METIPTNWLNCWKNTRKNILPQMHYMQTYENDAKNIHRTFTLMSSFPTFSLFQSPFISLSVSSLSICVFINCEYYCFSLLLSPFCFRNVNFAKKKKKTNSTSFFNMQQIFFNELHAIHQKGIFIYCFM